MNAKDYYQILGVSRTASPEEIKKAHRKLARKHHPDLNPGNKVSEDRFKEIQEAYDVLSDPEKRKKYDQYGEMWNRMNGAGPAPGGTAYRQGAPGGGSPFGETEFPGGVNFEDFLERMFGGRRGTGGASSPSQAPAEDIEFTIDISLEEAIRGVTKRINVSVEDVCPECEGMGQKRNSRGQMDLASAAACPRCHGTGRLSSPRSGQVTIPAGAWDGLRLKLAGQGAANARGKRGDLYVLLRILPNTRYEVNGQDLLFEVTIPFTVAALGGEVNVELPSGQRRQLVIPAGVQTGQKMRLNGQGMPALRDRKAGDAFARVKIVVPKDLSEREKLLIRELAEIRHDPVKN